MPISRRSCLLFALTKGMLPPNHLRFLGTVDRRLVERFAQFDLAMRRSIGGCLLAIGITCLLLINGPLSFAILAAAGTILTGNAPPA